jgi:Rps23 Pro-64 3,4-dihydroxylase Tpa1-like proline 4-hydroxylase|tara:strand:- start:56 stop:571 length:516 start_codon:yes stop_codon:yes gene_type:complete
VPGKIWCISDFLDHDIYKNIHDAIIKNRKKLKLQTVKGSWDNKLIKNISPPMNTSVNNYQPFEHLKNLVKHNPYFKIDNLKETTTQIHYMKKGTGINWHDDYSWRYGATFYINHKWNKSWGGEFMFIDKNHHGWMPPVGNSLIIVKAPISHKVNSVLSPIIPRISVQIFMR